MRNVSKQIVPIKIHQHSFFEPEEKAKPVNSKRDKSSWLHSDEFRCFLGAYAVTFGIVEDGQQIERGAKDKRSISLGVIAKIEIVSHGCFDAGQFVMQD